MYYIQNSNKLLFFFILVLSTMISISSNSWLGCWIGLEINLLSFIPLINKSNNLLISEASLKYFLIQTLSSMNFLFFILLNLFLNNNSYLIFNFFLILLVNLPLLMKMGAAPLHFWFPQVMEGLSWMNCIILMTWQKISPMIILSYCFLNKLIYFFIIMSSIFGALGGFNQSSLKKLMTYSSINHLSWMLSTLIINENLWNFYFLIYSFLTINICLMFYFLNMFFLNQLFYLNTNYFIKMFMFFNLISLSGMPPFLGFLPKWMVIYFYMNNFNYFLIFIMIMCNLITMFFYIQITYSSLIINYMKIKWYKIYLNMNIKSFMIMSLFSNISLIIMSSLVYLFY